MKKISLKNLNLQEVEQLSREQLKNVLGGFSGSGDDDNGDKKCASGQACQIVYTGAQGSKTYDGTCQSNTSGCFCDVGQGDPLELTSNGGVTKCLK